MCEAALDGIALMVERGGAGTASVAIEGGAVEGALQILAAGAPVAEVLAAATRALAALAAGGTGSPGGGTAAGVAGGTSGGPGAVHGAPGGGGRACTASAAEVAAARRAIGCHGIGMLGALLQREGVAAGTTDCSLFALARLLHAVAPPFESAWLEVEQERMMRTAHPRHSGVVGAHAEKSGSSVADGVDSLAGSQVGGGVQLRAARHGRRGLAVDDAS